MKYSTILIDPPWPQKKGPDIGAYKVVNGKQIFNIEDRRSKDLPYATMTMGEIHKLPVGELADKNCHLYIWVTNAFLPQVFDLIKQWGFVYSTTLVWAKNPMGGGLGGAYRITTEFLIYCRKGSLKNTGSNKGTWFHQKRTYENGYPKHSKKPVFFHEMIERMSPGPYLEMFAREERDNWSVFGNEVNNSITI